MAAGLATTLVFMFSGPGADDASSVVPASSWRNDLAFRLLVGLLIGLVLGIVSGLAYANHHFTPGSQRFGLEAGLGYGFGNGLGTGIVFVLFSAKTWQASLAFMQLAVRWHTPLRLMRFLEHAASATYCASSARYTSSATPASRIALPGRWTSRAAGPV
jgi:hypothetical protein